MGMFRIGAERFKNQFGVMGKSLRNSRKKNRLFLFSSTCRESQVSGVNGNRVQQGPKLDSSSQPLPHTDSSGTCRPGG